MSKKIFLVAWSCFLDVARHKAISIHIIFIIFSFGLVNLFSHFSTSPDLEFKMAQDIGISLIGLFSFLMALLIGNSTLRDELNRKTAYSILTLSISRSEYYLGKFFGALFATWVNSAIMVVIFAIMLQAKFGIFWSGFFWIAFFLLLEIATLCSIIMVFSLFDSTLLTFSFTFFLVILGNFSSYITHLIEETGISFLTWLGRIAFILIPNPSLFNVKTSILKSQTVSLSLTGWAIGYCFLYAAFSVGLGMFLMEKKDL